MKSLAKLLALFALIIVVAATVRSFGRQAESALTVGSCDYLSVSPNSGVAPLNTTLTISAHTTDGTPISRYVFNFGDGSGPVTQVTNSITHAYASVGNYSATASVIDQNGNVATSPSCQKSVTAISNVVCDSLTGQAQSRGGPPVTVSFSLSGHSNAGSITSYRFDFGDGSPVLPLTTAQTSHPYTSPGKFVARGLVVDSTGNTSPGSGSCTLNINVPPPGTLCLNWANGLCQAASSRTLPVSQDPDINIILRQFISVPGTMDIVNFEHDVAPAPQLCDMFASNSISASGKDYKTAFTSLYAVGVIGGIDATNLVEQNPPHMAGFQTTPGESVYAPPLTYYGSVGDGYNAILLYADDNSVVIKYTLDDDVIKGYTLHIMGISPSTDLQTEYNQAVSDNPARWFLPGINGSQILGKAKGNEVWVAIRDTGQFMDPRWQRDWWNNCKDQVLSKTTLTTTANPPGYSNTQPDKIKEISTGGPSSSLLGRQAKTYTNLPLGSLEICPGEIPVKVNHINSACVPVNSPGQPCVSECSEPIQVTENLRMFADQGCLRNGSCLAKIGINDKNLSLPFAKGLGDYFAGVLDAEHPDQLQTILKAGATDPSERINQIFQAAGVARKLLPRDIQDQLKCQFINYVKSKKIIKSDGTYPNTKYLGHTKDGQLDGTELMVFDRKVTDVLCPPNVEPQSAHVTRADWERIWSTYWLAVPLFPDDDTQGKIEFVSPSLFSTRERGNNPDFPQNELGPFYLAVPSVAKLASATGILQKALIPQQALVARAQALADDPATALPTYGKPINLTVPILACKATNWDQYYTADEQKRAVACNIEATASGRLQKICVVGPNGQLRCYQQAPGSAPSAGVLSNPTELVQVRTLVPNLFEIAEQTIDPATGLLRIFKPQTVNTLNQVNPTPPNPPIPDQNIFDKAFEPVAASGGGVRYYTSDRDITIDDSNKPNGWQIFFYRLGGVWNAKEFILKLLNPQRQNHP